MECHRTTEQTAYPVFYDVEPSEVRKQSGAVGEAFAKYAMEEAAGKWREALKEAADLAGWELKKTVDGHEAKFIQKIVEELSLELRSISFNIDEKLVGMETRIEDLEPSLGIGCDDVRMIGIKGIGGGGKTTLARAVFDHISFQFEAGVSSTVPGKVISQRTIVRYGRLEEIKAELGRRIKSLFIVSHLGLNSLRENRVQIDNASHEIQPLFPLIFTTDEVYAYQFSTNQ
ncbi:hypothetical protein L1887_35893 [Cichorium endivia]|nr:hypothetical protein L1887_35893 [Cichorium endivia]